MTIAYEVRSVYFEIIDVNKAFLEAFGYEKEELMKLGLRVIYFSEQERNKLFNLLSFGCG